MPAILAVFQNFSLGFAFAGLAASAFQLLAGRPASFGLLNEGGLMAAGAIPVLVFAAPLIIVRRVVRGWHLAPPVVGLAAIAIASLWGVLCGRVILDVATLLDVAALVPA